MIVQIPSIKLFNVKDNACMLMDEEWLPKTYNLFWAAIVVVAVVLMAGLYSRIVSTPGSNMILRINLPPNRG